MRTTSRCLMPLIWVFLFSAVAFAQLPRTIAYQGALTDAAGRPKADGDYSFVFTLYTAATGGSIVWQGTRTLTVRGGLFYTQLGTFPENTRFEDQYFLGVRVSPDPEMSPRMPLSSVAYALNVADSAITTRKLAWNAVTSEKLADNIAIGDRFNRGNLEVWQGYGKGNGVTVTSDSYGGILTTYNANDKRNTTLETSSSGKGALTLRNESGNSKISITATPTISLYNQVDGDLIAVLGEDREGGFLRLRNTYNNTIALIDQVENSRHGGMEIYDEDGNTRIRLTKTAGYTDGSVSVANNFGTMTAGLQGYNGRVWGTTKSFIIPDPADVSRMIQYTCIEGPEAAIYSRGTVVLGEGTATVTLPDHFTKMASPGTLTVNLTPRSAESRGLAAVDLTPRQLVIKELGNGTGSYPVDYTVYAVRKGHESYEVYMSAEEFYNSFSKLGDASDINEEADGKVNEKMPLPEDAR